MDTKNLLRKVLDSEEFKLDKIGWTECKTDKQILSYIRGYIWRTFGIRIKEPMDLIILFIINEALSNDMNIKRINNTIVKCLMLDCPTNSLGLCNSKKIKIEPNWCEYKNY